MATTGYASALGSLAKDAVVGAGKGFVGGLKGAMISEAPGIAGAYAFGKELRSRANAPKMPSGGSAPPSSSANKPSSSNSPMAGGLGTTNDKSIVAILRQSNIINLEQVRQLKQLNDNVINQSKLLKFTVDDTKRKDQFAEEVAKEQAFRDDRLLEAIKRIGSSDNKKQTKADDKKESSFLGKIGDFISDNIGTLITAYLGIKYGPKVLGALGGGGALGGMAGRKALGGMAGRALPQGAISVLDASGKVIAGAGAKSALVESIATVVPMVLRFLTGPIGLGIMAAAGMFALLKTASNPDYDPKGARSGKSRVDNSGAQDSKRPLTQAEAKVYLEDADRRKTNDSKLTPEQNKTKIDNADRTLNEYGGRQRVENVAKGLPEYSMPGTGKVSSLQGMRDLKDGKGPKPHNGVDYAMKVGTYISPIRPGKVESFESDGTKSDFGRHVIVDHGDGIKSTYAHLSEVSVKKGEDVNVNTFLGRSGGAKDDTDAGHATGPHLHLEIKQNGKYLTIADLPGLEASKELNRSVSRGIYNAANNTTAVDAAGGKTTAAGAAGGLLPSAKPGTRSDYDKTMRSAGSSAAVLFGQESYNKLLLPANRPVPIEADAPYFKRQALIAQHNKKNDQLIKASQGLDGKSADPKVTGELINKLKEDVKNLNDKIEDAKSLEMVLDEAEFSMAASVDAAMKRLGNLSPDEQKAVFSKMGDSAKEYEKELKKIFERIEGLKKLKGDPKKAKSEILNLLKDINKFWDNLFVPAKAPVVPKTSVSGVLGDGELSAEQRAKYGLDSPFLAKTNMQADPNARIVASLDSFLPDGGLTNINNTAGVEVVSKESNPFVALIERLLVMFRGGRSSSVKLNSSYFDDMHINDLFRKEERNYRVASDASNKLALDSFDKLASGTKIATEEIVTVVAPVTDKLLKAGLGQGKGGTAVAKQTFLAPGGKLLTTQAPPPFKPDYKSNTDIIAEANKQFLNELRSTLTGLTRKELKAALLPDGVGVSFGQANQDNLFRGEQLKQINDTSKKINEGAIDLFGKKFGPMFAPMLDKMSTSYFEVGSRLVGRQLFTRFGGLDAKETMGITGQVLGNIAAGKKQLAAEQLLFGMSGGRKTGIALNAESLFAKYGFEDPEQGISYFADVLGEKATQYSGLPTLMGADDRNKSIVRDPRTNKLVYVDSGIEASKKDIEAGYGGRISQTPLLGENNNYMEVPGFPGSVAGTGGDPNDPRAILNDKGKIIGRMAAGMTKSSVAGGSVVGGGVTGGGGIIRQILNADPKNISRDTVFGTTAEERSKGGDALRVKEDIYVRAQTELVNRDIQTQKDLATAGAKREYEAALKVAKTEEEANNETNKYNETLTKIQNANADVNAQDIINTLDKGQKGGAGDGTEAPGLKVSGRRPGQLFDANVYDKAGKIEGKDPMKEIGNFGFDMFKLAAGSELTKDIKNPYMQTITNFAIQKGMNYAVDAMMNSMTSTAAASSSGSSYGAVGDIFSSALRFIGLKDGGLVRRQNGGVVVGAGTGTSDSIPAYLSNGEFVVNAKAAAANMKLLDAINKSTLPKKTTAGSGTYIDERGGGNDAGRGPTVGSPSGPDALGIGPAQDRGSFRDIALAINDMGPVAKTIAGLAIPGFGIASFFSSRMAAADLAKSNVEGGQSQTMSQAKGVFRGLERSERNDTESSGARNFGKESSIPQGGMVSPGVTSGGRDGNGALGNSGSGAGTSNGGAQAEGGLITGKGSGTSDSIFSMLSNGEFVINAKATKANLSILKQINSYTGSGSVSKSQSDSNLSIEPFKNTFKGFADGGLVTASTMNAVPRPTSRSPYILSPQTNNSSSENQNNSSNMIIGPKTSTRIDNSSVTNFYNQASGMIDSIRSVTPQVA